MASQRIEMEGFHAFAFFYFLFSTITICTAVDTIGANESIRNGSTIVSSQQKFELGFFSPDEFKNWYIGIWYYNQRTRTVVWVANRETPLNDTNGVLQFTKDGHLVLRNFQEKIIWSTNSSRSPTNAVAQLLDSGNLVVKDGFGVDRPEDFLWQSFDYPCDTLLPDMKLGLNLVTGHEWALSSWKTESDPAQGKYVRRIDPKGYPQNFVTRGSEKISRLGPWNGLGFSGYTVYNPDDIAILEFNVSKEETFYRFKLKSTVLSRLALIPEGVVARFIYSDEIGKWTTKSIAKTDVCDDYAKCGAYGICDITISPNCKCLEGFKPKNLEAWGKQQFSDGCERKTLLSCPGKDIFIRHQSVKLPDTNMSWYNESMRLEECKTMCSKNCSCTAYANLDVRNGGTGCLLWFGDLIDIKESNTNPQDLYLRIASSEVGIKYCETCKFCGAYASCSISKTSPCECLEGFQAKHSKEWGMGNWSSGCVWKTALEDCKIHTFHQLPNIQLPDTSNASYSESLSIEECKTQCSNSCNCTAYATTNTKNGGTGCFLWSGELTDIGHCQTNGQDLYVKVPVTGKKPNNLMTILVSTFLSAFAVVFVGLSVVLWRRKIILPGRDRIGDLNVYDYPTIVNATNNFSEENKLGEGGFGPVYKGVLEDGLEIAVKKLAKKNGQGENEFKNEVMYIAKLQHKNLVKLLGYCLQGSEKILVYEYLPHKSLDLFIFDPKQSKTLDWSQRLEIIKKTARGLLYLHEDSRLNIIHRDVKASNILLDRDMNPKISDFGTARSFREEELGGTTKRLVGTYGYISPEYAMDGHFSAKSDVYSYGVLVLEILSGRKNGRLHQPGHRLILSGHAWNLFQEGRQVELIDASIRPPSDMNELLRAIHVGLLCVQHCPEDRPKMSTVVLMLEGDRVLPPPKEPGFYGDKNMLEAFMGETSSVQNDECSVNMVSITHIEGR